MLRFLHDIGRSAAGYFQPNSRDSSTQPNCNVTHSGPSGQEYVDKYTNKAQRGFSSLQWFGQDTLGSMQNTQQKAHRLITERGSVEELRLLLQSCPHAPHDINIRDMLGYNLLQYAIIANRVQVVRCLILFGADLNLPICARPLHLAAKLGYLDIIRLLLECGSDPDVMSCVCYPDSHILQRTMFVSDSECWSVACFGDIYAQDKVFRVQFEYPLYYAIMSDSIDCVLLLMSRGAGHLSSCTTKLHIACYFGAFQCIKYFHKLNPTEINSEDNKGLLPLQYAVRWGKRIVEYLVLKGSSVNVKTNYRESLLMLLYNQSKFTIGLEETSAYLLDCGLHMMVNVLDVGGNSPLHAFCKNLHRVPPKWFGNDPKTMVTKHKSEQTDKQQQRILESLCKSLTLSCSSHASKGEHTRSKLVKSKIKSLVTMKGSVAYFKDVPLSLEEKEYLNTLVILLAAGANSNVANKMGNTCLHELLKIQTRDMLKVDSSKPVHCSLRLIYCLLCVLFDNGANPRFVSNMHNTIHGYLVCSGMDAVFCQTSDVVLNTANLTELDYLIKCVWLLWEHGCNFATSCATTPLQHTLSKLEALEKLELQHQLSAEEKSELAAKYTKQVLQVVEAILDCGISPSDLQGLYYQLMKHYPMLSVAVIQQALLLFLHHGADPNIGGIHIPMSVFRSRSGHAHWPVYPLLHLLNLMSKDGQEPSDFYDLFDILYNGMDENGAKQCMFHFLSYDSNQSQNRNTTLMELVQTVMVTPKTLRQIVAQQVFVNICQRQKRRVQLLTLPLRLKNLLLSLQY